LNKLLLFRAYLYQFPIGTAEYLNLKLDTNIQDLELSKRFGLLYYYFLIDQIKNDKSKFELLKKRFHFNENLFSAELVDFCLQR
jgi:hypothetical protein